jgi:hypothetical protein
MVRSLIPRGGISRVLDRRNYRCMRMCEMEEELGVKIADKSSGRGSANAGIQLAQILVVVLLIRTSQPHATHYATPRLERMKLYKSFRIEKPRYERSQWS